MLVNLQEVLLAANVTRYSTLAEGHLYAEPPFELKLAKDSLLELTVTGELRLTNACDDFLMRRERTGLVEYLNVSHLIVFS